MWTAGLDRGSLRHRLLSGLGPGGVTFWGLAGGVVGRAANVAALLAAFYLTSLAEYGALALYIGLFQGLSGAGLLGLGVGTVRSVAGRTGVDDVGLIIRGALMLGAALVLPLAALGYVFAPVVLNGIADQPQLESSVRLAFTVIGAGVLIEVTQAVRVGLGRYRTAAVVEVVRGLSGAVALLVGVAVQGAALGFAALAASELVVACCCYAATWRLGSGGLHASLLAARGAVRDNVEATAATLGLQAALVVCQALVVRAEGAERFAVLALALRWGSPVLLLPGTFSRNYLGVVSRAGAASAAELRRATRAHAARSLAIAVAAAAVLAIASPALMTGGKGVIRSPSLLLICVLLYGVATAASTPLATAQFAQGKHVAWLLIDLLMAGVTVIAVVALLPIVGVFAYPVGLLLGTALAITLRLPQWPGTLDRKAHPAASA